MGPPANFSCFRSSPDSGAALAAAFATPTLEIAGSVHLPALAQAAVVFIKASERRSLLNGANAQSHIHHVMNANPPPARKNCATKMFSATMKRANWSLSKTRANRSGNASIRTIASVS